MSHDDAGYFERRRQLLAVLREREHGFATCAELASSLGWSLDEVRAKLMSLRRDGYVYYEPTGAKWRASRIR
jgi:DNA-binding IclR family transcriptional regulator